MLKLAASIVRNLYRWMLLHSGSLLLFLPDGTAERPDSRDENHEAPLAKSDAAQASDPVRDASETPLVSNSGPTTSGGTASRPAWKSLLAGLCCVALGAVAVLWIQSLWNSSATTTDAETSAHSSTTGPADSPPLTPDAALALQEAAVSKVEQIRMAANAERLRGLRDQLRQTSDELDSTLTKVLADTEGSRIAANTKLVDEFELFQALKRPREEQMSKIDREVTSLADSLQSDGDTVGAGFDDRLETLEGSLRTAMTTLELHSQVLDSLIAEAGSGLPLNRTLQQELDRRRQQREQSRLDELAERDRKKQQAEKLERDRLAAATAKRKQDLAEQERLMEQLRKEAESPEVLSLLAPFVAPDDRQPTMVTSMLVGHEITTERQGV